MVLLVRVEPEQHMDRWYNVQVQATLLDACAVVCTWGNRRTAYQRQHVFPVKTVVEAEALAEKIVARKLARGYAAQLVSG